jgi:hypothetical protein
MVAAVEPPVINQLLAVLALFGGMACVGLYCILSVWVCIRVLYWFIRSACR